METSFDAKVKHFRRCKCNYTLWRDARHLAASATL